MVNVIFDTNIYGKIAIDPDRSRLVQKLLNSHVRVHNFALVREELRRTSRKKIFKAGRKLRTTLLGIYDQVTANRVIPMTKEIGALAEDFHREYKRLGGGVGKTRIIDDFKIVACAVLKNLDLVVSDDNATMRSRKAILAYARVALDRNLRIPTFFSYKNLKTAVIESS